MNCKDLEELLSAYADGELGGTQRDFIEEHLESCADCRALLADYTGVRRQLLSLRATPAIPDIKKATMIKIKTARVPPKLRRWLRPALVGIPIIAILATALILQLTGLFISPSGVLSKAHAAMERIESYRVVGNQYKRSAYTENEIVLSYHLEAEYASTSKYHIIRYMPLDFSSSEMIVIDNQVYFRGDALRPSTPEQVAEGLPSKDQTLEMLDWLINLEQLKDEYVDDTLCFHYRGTADIDKLLEIVRLKYLEMVRLNLLDLMEAGLVDKDDAEKEKEFEESVEKMMPGIEERMRRREFVLDYWIGKDDYLIRQVETVDRGLSDPINMEITSIYKYSDFNENIIINPPLTETGELLEGWRVTSLWE
jgi:hypothetical protein